MDFCNENDDVDQENLTPSETKNIDICPEIVEKGAQVRGNLLPLMSKERYEYAHKQFMEWRRKNKVNSFSENVLLTYFGELSAKYKASTLWSIYSMLRGTLVAKYDINIATYCKLRALLKKKSVNYVAKKSNVLTSDNIKTFLQTASDKYYLLTKTALIFGISGCMKKGELYNLKLRDIQDVNSALIVDVPQTKTKEPRKFVITDYFYMICKKYINLRPIEMSGEDHRFFVNYQKGKCTTQFLGINKFGRLVQDVAKFLKLPNPETYTGHSYRRTSATIVADRTGDLALSRHGGWKSSRTAEGYVNNSINKTEIPEHIEEDVESSQVSFASQPPPLCETTPAAPGNNWDTDTHKIQNFVSTKEHEMVINSVQGPIYFQNCSHLTINFNLKN